MDADDQTLQVIRVDRLDQVVIEASLDGATPVTGLSPPRQGNQSHVHGPRLAAQMLRDFIAAQVRHADVKQDNVGSKCGSDGKGGSTQIGNPGFVSRKLQQHRQAFRRIPVVVDDENPAQRALRFASIWRRGGRLVSQCAGRKPYDKFAALT